MPATTDLIVVDPNGLTLTVDITDRFDVSVTAYTASGGSSAHTLPLEIDEPTEFHLTAPGEYTVSAKIFNTEIAGDTVTARHGVPVTVTPSIGPDRVAAIATASQVLTDEEGTRYTLAVDTNGALSTVAES